MIGTKPYAKLKYREVPILEAVANVKRRVRRFGCEARMADDVLQVPDPRL